MNEATRSKGSAGAAVRCAVVFILALLGAAGPISSAMAQDDPRPADMVMRIAAVVNDDIISVYDVEARSDLLIASARLPDTAEVRDRIRSQVLRALISETLKLQEGERAGVSVSETELNEAIRQVEQQNGLPPGGYRGFVNANGLDMDNALRQVRAEVTWIKAIRSQFGPRVDISQEQVDLVMQRLQAAQGKPEHLVWEIYLPVENPTLDGRVRQDALELIDQLRQGAAFPALARQFSQSPSAAKGGRLGWVRQGELDTTLEQALLGMPEGSVSDPIRTAAGYYILRLEDRRRTAEPEPEKARLTISQLALPSRGPKAMSRSSREEIKSVVAETVQTCEDLNALAEKLEAPNSGTVGTVPVARLEGPMRDVLLGLGENEVSEPIQTPNGELLLMVCSREVPGGMPSESDILDNLRRERLETLANRRLSTLRQQALIDIRI
jgi:peptidyl-prolyl cis-trans isomerase SurA